MRCRIAVSILLAVLPLMNVLAAPAPECCAILDIGPPRKGETADEYRKTEIERLRYLCLYLALDSEVKKLSSVAALKKPLPWLKENLRIREEGGGCHLRLTFQAGNHTEQVIILNTLLRVYIRVVATERIQAHEKGIRWEEARILEFEKRIESGQHPDMVDTYRKGIDNVRTIEIPARRAEIARLKQITAIKWAR